MAVSHVYSSPVADATGTQTIWYGATTVTVAATDNVRPSDWNSAHQQYMTVTGNTAGQSTFSGTNIVIGGGANVTISGVNATRFDIVGGAGAAGNTGSISAGTTRGTLGEVVFSNSNGISFGIDGQTLTAQHNALTTARASNDAIGLNTAQTNVTWTVNSAGLSLNAAGYAGTGTTFNGAGASGSITQNSAGLQLSLSVTQSNQAVSAANGSYAFQTLSFSNANGVSFGTSAGSAVTASYTVPTVTNSSWTVSDNASSATVARLAFTNLNGVTLSLSTGANGSHTIVGSHNALTSQSNQNVTAANGGFAFQTLSFSNANGVSFGTSAGSAITGSVAAQTNQTGGIYVTAQSTGQSSSSTYDARSLSIIPDGIISAGWSNGSFRISATQSNQAFSAGAASSAFQTLVFQDSNGISFSNNAGSIRATYTRNVASNAIASVGSATNSGTNTSRFAADDHVHAGVFSVGVSNVGNTAGDTRVDVGRFVLAGGANITLSQATAANALNTISIVAGAGGGETRLTAYAVSNTTQSTSGTIPLSVLSFAGAGIASVGITNGSVLISVPAGGGAGDGFNILAAGTQTAGTNVTVSLANSNNITFGMSNSSVITASFNAINVGVSTDGNTAGTTGTVEGAGGQYIFVGSDGITLSQSTNGANSGTVTILGLPNLTRLDPYGYGAERLTGNPGQGSLQLMPFNVPRNVEHDRIIFEIVRSNSSNSTGSATISKWVGLYTQNVSTLSLLASTSTSQAVTFHGTVSSWSQHGGIRLLTIPWTQTITHGEYVIGIINRTTSGGTNCTVNFNLVSQQNSTFGGIFNAASATSAQLMLGQGQYSASTTAFPASIAYSQIIGTGGGIEARPVIFRLISGTV